MKTVLLTEPFSSPPSVFFDPQAGAPPFARRIICPCGLSGLFTTRASKRTLLRGKGGGRRGRRGWEIRYNCSQCKRSVLRFPNVYTREHRDLAGTRQLRRANAKCEATNGTTESDAVPGKLTFFSRSPRSRLPRFTCMRASHVRVASLRPLPLASFATERRRAPDD